MGIVTDKIQKKENYYEELRSYMTMPNDEGFKFEYIRFENETPVDKEIQGNPHIAFKVVHLEPYLDGNQILMEPMELNDGRRVAFIKKEGMIIELIEE